MKYKVYHIPSAHEFFFKEKPKAFDIYKRLEKSGHGDEIYEYFEEYLDHETFYSERKLSIFLNKKIRKMSLKKFQEICSIEITYLR